MNKIWVCAGCVCGLIGVAPGCAMLNSFLDPTTVGSFPLDYREGGIRRVLTPRDTPPGVAGSVEPTPEDLVPRYEEYRLGPNDQVAIVINDLIVQGFPEQSVQEISPSGMIRLPVLGSIKVSGMTEQDLEQEIKTRLREGQILPDPIVRVFVQVPRQRFFTIFGAVASPGPFAITQPDLRLLDAIGMARGIVPDVKRLYIIRREEPPVRESVEEPMEPVPSEEGLVIPPPSEEDRGFPGQFATGGGTSSRSRSQPQQRDAEQEADDPDLDALLAPPRVGRPAASQDVEQEPPQRPFSPLIFDPDTLKPQEEQVAREARPQAPLPAPSAERKERPGFDWEAIPEYELAHRIIEIDVTALKAGDPRYNVVIQNRDTIHVPIDTSVFYMMGEVNRPGVFAFNGREITIKQAVAISGGLSALAWPQRCEIIRREPGTDKQITVSVNLDAIFAGLEPDVMLRDEDIVNVGTHTVAPFLFVIRNSFRFTYGFGFVYDRNFADRDAYFARSNPEALEQARRASRGLPF